MDAIGQLTGGIAHDFNNILTVITGTIEILASPVDDRPQYAAIAKMIDQAAERGAELTRHLLAVARKQPLRPRETDVNALIVEHDQAAAAVSRRARRDRIHARGGRLAGAGGHLAAHVRPAQSRGERARCHGERRQADAGDRQHLSRRGLRPEPGRSSARAIRDDCGERQRKRNSGCDPRQGVRAVLHHERHRQGYRTWPEHGLWLCQAIGRAHQSLQRRRARNDDQAVPAAGGHIGGRSG